MDNSRRTFLKTAATAAAAAGALSQGGTAQAQVAAEPGRPTAPKPGAKGLRLVTFAEGTSDASRVGVVKDDGRLVDLAAAGKALPFDHTSMVSLIAAGPDALEAVRKLASGINTGPMVSEVTLLPPIPKPTRNVYAVGWNYLEHFQEGEKARGETKEYPEHPVFFTKGVHTVNGPYDPIPFDPKVSTMIDWECELAVVIGQRGTNIPEDKAMEHVFGYMVINDTTARDIQTKKHGGQWFKGKSINGHGPIGPWIIPAAELDYDNLSLRTRVNGVEKQNASTKQMFFKVPRIIAELSLGLTLEPGDIIATGTPPGVGFARKPPEFLKPGDVLETEILEIGVLRNVIQAVPA